MAKLTLEQFRDSKHRGFPGWETATAAGAHADAGAYVEPVDARYGGPSFPFGTDPALTGPAFERWCAERLAGDHFVTAGPWTGLVYCRLKDDAALVQRCFAAPSGAAPAAARG